LKPVKLGFGRGNKMDREDKLMIIWWAVTGVLMIGWFIGTMYGIMIIASEVIK
jgi:hypothetical protein